MAGTIDQGTAGLTPPRPPHRWPWALAVAVITLGIGIGIGTAHASVTTNTAANYSPVLLRQSSTGPRIYFHSTNTTIPAGQNAPGDAFCNAGDKATGGGYTLGIPSITEYADLYVGESLPMSKGTNNDAGWRVDVYNTSPDTLDLSVTVVCEHL